MFISNQFPQRILKIINNLYKDININLDNVPLHLLNLDHDEEIVIDVEKEDSSDSESENPVNDSVLGASEVFVMQSEMNSELLELAPVEGKTPTSILMDKFCKELAFPNLLPNGCFGYQVERDIKLSPSKYFNQRLLNCKQNFASNSDYIFFTQFVLQQLSLSSQINIALKKTLGNVTAGMLSTSRSSTVKSLIVSDSGYMFINTIKGSPAYWKRFQLEALAMIRQLGCPTFFLTLSAADLRWDDLVAIIAKLQNKSMSEEEIQNLSYIERCEILNSNPVLVARHIQYRVKNLFAEVLFGCDAIEKITNYAIRVEFQFRGVAHTHSLIWTLNSPELTEKTIPKFTIFIDSVIKAQIPDESENKDLHDLVKTYQLHKHTRSCQKYRNTNCRYSYGRFFTERTIIAQPVKDDLSPEENNNIIAQRNATLSKVKLFIDEYLDPSKTTYMTGKTISDILTLLELSSTDYYKALSISSSSDYEIHYQRNPDSCFINNYNPIILEAWRANIDIQPVFNYYKAACYMTAYFSKSETESSQALRQASKECNSMNLGARESMYKVASAFATSRQVSIQEAVYYSLPELWLRKCFPKVLYINSNIPSERIRMCKSPEQIEELDPDSTDIFKRNIVDRYVDRPDPNFKKGSYAVVDNMCLAIFASYYYVDYCIDNNDSQPDLLTDDVSAVNHHTHGFPKTLPLMSSSEKLKCRRVQQVLRYHIPNKELHPEKYAHYVLFLFYPFRMEIDLLLNNSYCAKLQF